MKRLSRRFGRSNISSESLSLESIDVGEFEPRLVRLCHAIDHLKQLHEDLTNIPPKIDEWKPPPSFEAAARALGAWLDAHTDPPTASASSILDSIEAASTQLEAERRTGREKILEDIALQRMPISTAQRMLDMLTWADGAVHHVWRMINSLSIASSK